MALAAVPIIPRDGVLVIQDGAALSLTIAYLNGAIKISGLNATQRTKQWFKSKGSTYSGRDVEDQEFSFEFTADAVHFMGDGTTATLFEAIMRKGVWAAAASTLPASAGDIYTLKGTWTVNRTNFGATSNNVVVAKYVQFDMDFSEGVPSQFSLKGTGAIFSTDYLTWT